MGWGHWPARGGARPQRARGVRIGQDQNEFLASQSHGGVAGAGDATQLVSHVLQDQVTRRVSTGVVDPLEMIKINEHDAQGRAATPAVRTLALAGFAKPPAVEEPGQTISHGPARVIPAQGRGDVGAPAPVSSPEDRSLAHATSSHDGQCGSQPRRCLSEVSVKGDHARLREQPLPWRLVEKYLGGGSVSR
jgi:hypothetical protein